MTKNRSQSRSSKTHAARDQVREPSSARPQEIESAVMRAYKHAIVHADVALIQFGNINGLQLARIFCQFPDVVGPTLAYLNVELPKIKRDLGFDFSTAFPLTESQALFLAGYAKWHLKEPVPVRALALRAYWEEIKQELVEQGPKRNIEGTKSTRGLRRKNP
jgi:hypothetical protein